jgi:glucokinase
LLEAKLANHPDHELAKSTIPAREKALSLRSRAQTGDPLALEIFDFQARALGFHVANLALALDASIVIIGGGLMGPEATRAEFRERYLGIIKESAMTYVWPSQRGKMRIVPAVLGDPSQAIGAALVALYQNGS